MSAYPETNRQPSSVPQGPAPAGQPTPPPQPPAAPPPRVFGTARDKVFGWLVFAFCALWFDFALFYGFRLGFAVITGVFFVLLTVYLAGGATRFSPYALLCGIAAAAGGVPFALHNDPLLRPLSVCAIFVLFILYGALITGSHRHPAGDYAVLGDVAAHVFVTPFRRMGAAMGGLFGRSPVNESEKPARGKSVKVLIGVLCAVPALAVLIPLMIRSSRIFGDWLSHISFDVGTLLGRVFLAALVFPLVFSLLFAWKKGLTRPGETSAANRKTGGLDRVIVQTFLWILTGVHLVYLVTQALPFLIPVLREEALSPDGIADFARRGFFEMCGIAAVDLALLFLAMAGVKKEDGRLPSRTKWLSLVLCLFTVGVIGTALTKMCLYIGRFGLTRLRVLTACFMVFLLLVFMAAGVRLLARRFPVMKMIVVSFCVIWLAMGFCDVDTVIARYNVEAYQTGRLETVDVQTLDRLTDGAVPYVLRLLDDKDPAVVTAAHDALVDRFFRTYRVELADQDSIDAYYIDPYYYHWDETKRYNWMTIYNYAEIENQITVTPRNDQSDWRGYNRDAAAAQRLLLENRERLLCPPPDGWSTEE